MTRVLIFGDSITYGYYDKKGGWVNRLGNLFMKKMLSNQNFDYAVYNLGISGNTTKDLLERLESETKQRMKENGKIIIILEIGINDSQFINDEKKLMVLPKEFKKNIKKLIDFSRKFTRKIVFVGLTPVDEPKVTPVP